MAAKKAVKNAPEGKTCCGHNTWGWVILVIGAFVFLQELFEWNTRISIWAVAFILFGIFLVKGGHCKC